jgi:hypothetical protein
MAKNRIRLSALTIMACVVCASPSTRAENACDGHWIGHYVDTAKRWDTVAELTVSGDAGEWVSHIGNHKAPNSPCREHTFPVAVVKCTDTEFHFPFDGGGLIATL